jgi:hypothetical protein
MYAGICICLSFIWYHKAADRCLHLITFYEAIKFLVMPVTAKPISAEALIHISAIETLRTSVSIAGYAKQMVIEQNLASDVNMHSSK